MRYQWGVSNVIPFPSNDIPQSCVCPCDAVKELQSCLTWTYLRLNSKDQLAFDFELEAGCFDVAARANSRPFGG